MKLPKNIEELKLLAYEIPINKKLDVVCPRENDIMEITFVLEDYEIGGYNIRWDSMHNGILAFATTDVLYVIPLFEEAITILKSAGFKCKDVYVPFVGGDYPLSNSQKWLLIRDVFKTN